MVPLFQILVQYNDTECLGFGRNSLFFTATAFGKLSFIHCFDLGTSSSFAALIGAIFGLYQAGGLFGGLFCALRP